MNDNNNNKKCLAIYKWCGFDYIAPLLNVNISYAILKTEFKWFISAFYEFTFFVNKNADNMFSVSFILDLYQKHSIL